MNEEIKPGLQSSEFWVTVVTNILLGVVALLAMRGVISQEERQLWVQLAESLALAIVTLGIAISTAAYSQSRARVKEAAEIRKGAAMGGMNGQ